MKHVQLPALFLLAALCWTRPAQAQIGILSLVPGMEPGPQAQHPFDAARKQNTAPAPPPLSLIGPVHTTHSAQHAAASVVPGLADRYGRADLSGKPISGYPAIRGVLQGPGAMHVARGGANGHGRRAPANKKK